MNMIASCKRRDDLLAEYITLTECSYMNINPNTEQMLRGFLVRLVFSKLDVHITATVVPRGVSQNYH